MLDFQQFSTVASFSNVAEQNLLSVHLVIGPSKALYLSGMYSFPSTINLYLIRVLLFIPINKPTEIINRKSNIMVAIIAVELLTLITPRLLGENKLPINNTDIIILVVVPITYAR